MEAPSQKSHNKTKAGRGSKEKKKSKLSAAKGEQVKRHNVKAFGVANTVRTKRNMQRNLDKTHQKEYAPSENDRRVSEHTQGEESPRASPVRAPPVTIVVMGPPKCGKSTLIRSLVKVYTNHNLTEIVGPITAVAAKTRRVTFVECPNTTTGMLDCAKVADLVLLCVDAKFGFEMETFEFLNILQTHGFPKVMGVLTHLDEFKTAKALRASKKMIKHRFWTEIYQGAKIFHFNGIINNKYLKNECKQLTLYINRVKFRPLQWRNTHPYVIIDRHEDITVPSGPNEEDTGERTVTFYGYVRGTNLRPNQKVHLIGAGDFQIKEVSAMPDPCPFPSKNKDQSLSKKDTLLYAPLSNVGAVMVDKDAVYVEVGKGNYTKRENILAADRERVNEDDDGEGGYEEMEYDPNSPAGMLKNLQDVKNTIGDKMKESQLRIFKRGKAVRAGSDSESDSDDGRDSGEEVDSDNEHEGTRSESSDEEGIPSSDDESDEDERRNSWKVSAARNATTNFLERKNDNNVNLQELVYGGIQEEEGTEEEEEGGGGGLLGGESSDDSDDDDFFKIKKPDEKRNSLLDASDSSSVEDGEDDTFRRERRYKMQDSSKVGLGNGGWGVEEWMEEDGGKIESLRDKFVTGNWENENGIKEEGGNPQGGGDDSDGSVYDDFEDFETGEKVVVSGEGGGENDADYDMDELDDVDTSQMTDDEIREYNRLKKERSKADFNKVYDGEKKDAAMEVDAGEDEENEYLEVLKREKEEKMLRNATEFGSEGERSRVKHEGYRQGMYVRVKLEKVPVELLRNFDPTRPFVLGGLLPNECSMGLIRCRFKKHRWHSKILKCNDPLIFSVGWRRFQSCPLLSTEDQNDRHRYLKYTPEHMHCFATFYGPLVPPNTGLVAFKDIKLRMRGFRIAATGNVLEGDQSFEVVKKLKLVGTPGKIYKNTAFVKDMFNSDMEASRFEGGTVKTVSGIRGQIKKANGTSGEVRCTFEDKVLASDIVFCRTWMPVEAKRYYNPVTDVLDGGEKGWRGMKGRAELMIEKGKPIEVKGDSVYKPIVRKERKFNGLKVPKSLEEALPYKSKQKNTKQKKGGYATKRAVVLEKDEIKKNTFLQSLTTVMRDKKKIRKKANEERMEKKRKEWALDEDGREEGKKRERKKQHREKGKEEKRREMKRIKG
ncbi:hypothetical protein TrCOL_g8852 [Triparma columacea]|uniref:Bms1-type G domain-containing protein n=1 Tax=Triparma columacea TaxID=722753 RepID=A0A9W7GB47_9STRA|nr:hypothetical protein TrCOL_g8852 [Triparma columacea]